MLQSSAAWRRRARVYRKPAAPPAGLPRILITLASILAVAGLSGQLLADEARASATKPARIEPVERLERRVATPKAAARSERGARVVSNMAVQLESLSAFRQTMGPGQTLGDHVLFDAMSDGWKRSIQRATRRTVRDYLLEVTQLDLTLRTIVERQRARFEASREGSDAGSVPVERKRNRVRFDLGVHSGNPVLEMRYDMNRASVRLDVNDDGAARLRFRSHRSDRSEISAAYDGERDFSLNMSLRF